jgi:CO/xanthine dehydrogenase Mo-binding subunit
MTEKAESQSSNTESKTYKFLGQRIPLHDGIQRLQGEMPYTGDLEFAGMLHLRLVISPHAHAKIKSIDLSNALKVPGVMGVFRAEDLPCGTKVINSRTSAVLAKKRVLFNGQPVVAVAGESIQAAEDGAEKVKVEYELLDPVIDLEEAVRPEGPVIWPEGIPDSDVDLAADHGGDQAGKQAQQGPRSNVNQGDVYERGDLEQGFRLADVIIERTYRTSFVHQSYLEPQVCVVNPEIGGRLSVYVSTQGPRSIRKEVARLMSLPLSKVNVVPMAVGGGFGGKHGLIEPLVAAVALKMRRPVRLELNRGEDFMGGMPSPACQVELKTGATSEGTFCALEARILMDNGIFASPWGNLLATLLGSTYNVPHARVEYSEVNTNKPMGGPYRAPSAPLSAYVLESNVDLMVKELELDPLEFRYHNAASTGDEMINGTHWQSVNIQACLERLKEHPLYQNNTNEENTGSGFAVGVWRCNVSPAGANCRMLEDGTMQLYLGTSDISGIHTGFAQVVAETLDLPLESIEVIQQDTQSGPIAPVSGGSMVSYSVIPAIREASEEVRERLLKLASEHFEASTKDLELHQGSIRVKGVPSQMVSLTKLVKKAESSRGGEGPVMGSGKCSLPENAPAASVHWVKVKVDPETGEVTPLHYLAIQDVGFALNPMLIEGQIHGGVVQGLGWGMREGMEFDEQGVLLNPSFMDYALFRADEIPPIEIELIEAPSPYGPYGIRGVGEPPIVPGAAALASALQNTTGVRICELPISSESLWQAMTKNGF